VVEPIQGEAGVIAPPPGFLRALGALAAEHGIIVVADEIQSGLGRTGHWFASVADGLDPDIITLAKPLGGGIVPIGAVIARRSIYRAMLSGVKSKLHSNTFGGGALACAVALRSLELIHDEGLVEKAREDGAYGLERLRAIRDAHPQLIGEVRAAGMLFAITIKPVLPGRLLPIDPALVPQLSAFLGIAALHRAGVHACYSENAEGIVRFTPPLTIPRPTLATMFDRVEAMAGAAQAARQPPQIAERRARWRAWCAWRSDREAGRESRHPCASAYIDCLRCEREGTSHPVHADGRGVHRIMSPSGSTGHAALARVLESERHAANRVEAAERAARERLEAARTSAAEEAARTLEAAEAAARAVVERARSDAEALSAEADARSEAALAEAAERAGANTDRAVGHVVQWVLRSES
jgi:vacuolar-type H+-ATPase subunit H